MTPLLEVGNLVKHFGAVRAVDGVSLEIFAGSFVALVGRSGCGKSTLLNLAGAMDFPTSGEVRLDGISTSSLDDAGLTRLRREKVGFIFQSFQLLPTLSVVPEMRSAMNQSISLQLCRKAWKSGQETSGFRDSLLSVPAIATIRF